MDSALDDFLSRFGDKDPNKYKVQNQKRIPATLASELNTQGLTSNLTRGLPGSEESVSELKTQGLTDTFTKNDPLKGMNGDLKLSDTENLKKSGHPGVDLAGDALGLAANTVEMVNFAKKSQYDTSAEGGGPGKASAGIMQGTAKGAEMGATVGKFLGPVGGAIATVGGAALGGLVSAFAHKGAMREYSNNRRKANQKKDVLSKAKLEEDYAISEGLASMQNLKSLREKQLGIYNG